MRTRSSADNSSLALHWLRTAARSTFLAMFAVSFASCASEKAPKPLRLNEAELNQRTFQPVALTEFKLYVAPMLARLRESGSEPLTAYLSWAVTGKSWIFLDVPPEMIPEDRSIIPETIDEFARQSAREIFIDVRLYEAATNRQRAFLLLREMVRAAALLAATPPTEQCKALGTFASPTCADSTLVQALDLKWSSRQTEATESTLAEARTLAAFLLEADRQLTAARLAEARRAKGWVLPWDL